MSDERETITVAEAYKRRVWESPGVVLSYEHDDCTIDIESISPLRGTPCYKVEMFCAGRRATNYLDSESPIFFTDAGEVLQWGANNWRQQGWMSGDEATL